MAISVQITLIICAAVVAIFGIVMFAPNSKEENKNGESQERKEK